jgi:hypothetical protein
MADRAQQRAGCDVKQSASDTLLQVFLAKLRAELNGNGLAANLKAPTKMASRRRGQAHFATKTPQNEPVPGYFVRAVGSHRSRDRECPQPTQECLLFQSCLLVCFPEKTRQ